MSNYIVSFSFVTKYFIEYMKTFTNYCVISSSELESIDTIDELLVVQNANWVPEDILKKTKKLRVVNTEQLCLLDVENRVVNELKAISGRIGYRVEVIDYARTNIDILKKHGIVCTLHPYDSPPEEKAYLQNLVANREKFYDIGFVGYINPRRKHVLDKLSEKGYKVFITQTFGNERDSLLANCKSLINIHCEEYFDIFESIRCNRWLSAGQTVISEKSRDCPDSEFLKQFSYADLCALDM
jgi:hypothetical protein